MDWDNDGTPDLIHGERNGNLRLYTGNGDGTLHFIGNIYDNQGTEIKTNFNSSPHLVDWNEDGRLDLLLSGYLTETTNGGILRVYPNIGDNPDSPVFSAVYLDYTGFYNKWRTTAEAFDLNADGKKDLVLGYEMGEVFFAPNTGTNADPQFSSYAVLQCAAGPVNVYTNFSGGGRAREHVCDYNADGIPDLMVGCNNGWIYVFPGNTQGVEAGAAPVRGFSVSILESPCTGEATYRLELQEGLSAAIDVYDLSGRRVMHLSEVFAGEGMLDLGGQPSGIYMVTARHAGQRVTARLTLL